MGADPVNELSVLVCPSAAVNVAVGLTEGVSSAAWRGDNNRKKSTVRMLALKVYVMSNGLLEGRIAGYFVQSY